MIQRERHGDVVVLRMAHGKVNALDLELLRELVEALDATPGPVVLTGRGGSFSAGVDLRRILDEPRSYTREFLVALTTAFRRLFEHPAPVVAAVNGHAIAGGFVLVAACDQRVAADRPARFGLTELAVGVPFPVSAIEIVRHAVGPASAERLALSAALFDTGEAVDFGLLDEIVPPDAVLDVAIAHAVTRSSRGIDAYRLTKAQLRGPAVERIRAAEPTDAPAVADAWTADASHDRIRRFLAGLG